MLKQIRDTIFLIIPLAGIILIFYLFKPPDMKIVETPKHILNNPMFKKYRYMQEGTQKKFIMDKTYSEEEEQ